MKHLPAYHHGRQLPFGHLTGFRDAHQLALAHDPHPIGDGRYLIQLMGNENYRHALFPDHRPERLKQFIRLLRGEHSSRLVQNENIRPPVQGLQNFHTLLQADAQLAYPGIRLHPQPVLLRQSPDLFPRRFPGTENPAPARLPAQNHVLGHREGRNQHKMLMYHTHPPANGRPGAEMRYRLSLDCEPASCGRINTVQNIHQGAFPRAVFSHQCKNFPLLYGQRHIVIGQNPGKFHGDMGKLNHRLLQTDHLPFQQQAKNL